MTFPRHWSLTFVNKLKAWLEVDVELVFQPFLITSMCKSASFQETGTKPQAALGKPGASRVEFFRANHVRPTDRPAIDHGIELANRLGVLRPGDGQGTVSYRVSWLVGKVFFD